MAASASASKPIALITGASRGIGLGLVEAYVAKGYRVVAAVRDPSKADKLNALIKTHGAATLQVVKLDVSDAKSIAALPAALAALPAPVKALDVLINNAGILSPSAAAQPGGITTLATETPADLAAVFHTNVIGVFSVTNTLLPLLRAAAAGAKVVNIGSILGSVDFIVTGPWPPMNPAYLISKAALNQLSAIQARALNADTVAAEASTDAKVKAAAKPLITVVSMHPGWVDTDMGSSGGGKPPVTVPQSAGGIEQVVSKLKPTAKVLYLDFEGKPLNW